MSRPWWLLSGEVLDRRLLLYPIQFIQWTRGMGF